MNDPLFYWERSTDCVHADYAESTTLFQAFTNLCWQEQSESEHFKGCFS
jgi:hypothetical protein